MDFPHADQFRRSRQQQPASQHNYRSNKSNMRANYGSTSHIRTDLHYAYQPQTNGGTGKAIFWICLVVGGIILLRSCC